MARADDGSWAGRLRRAFRQIGPVRLIVTVAFLAAALYVARYDWQVPLLSDAERALYDLRFSSRAERVAKDPRVVLVVYNDDTLDELRKRSPLDRRMLARALRALDRMQPRAIGIDILFDQVQDEDEELVQAFRSMRTPTYVAFASHVTNPDRIGPRQEQFLRDLMRRIGPGQVRLASIKLEPDIQDGVTRRWSRPDDSLPPVLSNAMTADHPEFRSFSGSLDYRLPNEGVDLFNKVTIDTLAAIESDENSPEVRAIVANAFAQNIRGRYILIGGDIADSDDFETPMTRFTGNTTKGLEIHAHMLAQQLDGRMRTPVPAWALWLAALAVIAAGGLTSALELRRWLLALVLVVQLALIGYTPFLLHAMRVDTIDLPAFGWGAGWLLAFIGVGAAARAVGSEQKRFAQSALGKYLPRDVAQEIMRDPAQLALHGEKTQIYALFTDLEGFTKLSHAITPETLSRLLNRYLDLMSEIVLKHGGTLDKFVGDALVTFWGAPIAREGDADRAVQAGLAMYRCGEEFRRSAREIAGDDEVPPIGVTRVGLHRGEAVVGNFGGEGRIQYTALGDAMNTAARLESANKALKTTMLVSEEARRESGIGYFRPMGRIVLSGRATPVMVWEPVPDMDEALRGQLNDLWARFDGGEQEALVQLESIAGAHKEDAALQYLVYRLREVGPGGHFVLGSK